MTGILRRLAATSPFLGRNMSQQQKIALSVYAALLLLCVCLIIGSEFLGPTVRASLLPVSVESFKLVLAALVGAISAMLGVRNGNTS
jgi:hypothetical protein